MQKDADVDEFQAISQTFPGGTDKNSRNPSVKTAGVLVQTRTAYLPEYKPNVSVIGH
jgi:hypothetical protein